MKISAELSPRCPPADIPRHARAIERAGFYRIWARDMGVAPWEMWAAATACALSTKRIRIGLDVTNVYTRSLAVTAHAAATLDQLSGGRLDLGFGQGIPKQLALMGLEIVPGALEAGLKTVRDLLQGKEARLGKEPLKLATLPQQRFIPIYLACMKQEDFQLAGRIADGVLTISASQPFLTKAIAWTKEAQKQKPTANSKQRIANTKQRTANIATWLPFSQSAPALDAYLQRMLQFLPQDFFALAGLDPKKSSPAQLKDSLLIDGLSDLAKKARTLSRLGISEIILEYLSLSDLRNVKRITDALA